MNSSFFVFLAFCTIDLATESMLVSTVQEDQPLLVGPKRRDVLPEDLAAARQKMVTTRGSFKRMQELAKRGSVSKVRLQRAELEKRIAELELEALENPELANRNQRLIAKLNLEFSKNKLARSKKLFSTGSVSELDYRRDLYQLKYAQIGWKEATGEISADIAKIQIAQQRLKLAQTELDLGQRLYEKKSLSRSTIQELQQRVKEIEQELGKLKHQQKLKKQKLDQQRRT